MSEAKVLYEWRDDVIQADCRIVVSVNHARLQIKEFNSAIWDENEDGQPGRLCLT